MLTLRMKVIQKEKMNSLVQVILSYFLSRNLMYWQSRSNSSLTIVKLVRVFG
jgi:hypothetical protein